MTSSQLLECSTKSCCLYIDYYGTFTDGGGGGGGGVGDPSDPKWCRATRIHGLLWPLTRIAASGPTADMA